MKISRITIITLGVADLKRATEFYAAVLGTSPNRTYDGVTFIELPGTWISLYPLENLAKDISPDISVNRCGFSGITLAHNARSAGEVVDIVQRAGEAGGRMIKRTARDILGRL